MVEAQRRNLQLLSLKGVAVTGGIDLVTRIRAAKGFYGVLQKIGLKHRIAFRWISSLTFIRLC